MKRIRNPLGGAKPTNALIAKRPDHPIPEPEILDRASSYFHQLNRSAEAQIAWVIGELDYRLPALICFVVACHADQSPRGATGFFILVDASGRSWKLSCGSLIDLESGAPTTAWQPFTDDEVGALWNVLTCASRSRADGNLMMTKEWSMVFARHV